LAVSDAGLREPRELEGLSVDFLPGGTGSPGRQTSAAAPLETAALPFAGGSPEVRVVRLLPPTDKGLDPVLFELNLSAIFLISLIGI